MIIAESNGAEGRPNQVRSVIGSVVERIRAEDGCLRYELLQDLEDANQPSTPTWPANTSLLRSTR